MGDPGHGQVHAYLGAFAGEVGAQAVDDLCLHILGDVSSEDLADTDNVLGSPGHFFLLLGESGPGHLALGAEFRGSIPLMYVTTYRANPLFHSETSNIKSLFLLFVGKLYYIGFDAVCQSLCSANVCGYALHGRGPYLPAVPAAGHVAQRDHTHQAAVFRHRQTADTLLRHGPGRSLHAVSR